MNAHLKHFLLIFCLIGVAICAFLAIVNASAAPSAKGTAALFGVVAVVLAVGAVGLRTRREF